MKCEILSETQFNLLKQAQHLKTGEVVYAFRHEQCEVVAPPGPDNSVAVRDPSGNLKIYPSSWLKLAPLLWLEGKPVYPGDTLYWADHTTCGSLEVSNTCPDWVIGNTPRGGIRLRERFLSWNEVRWLEDQLLRIGDMVYKKWDATPLTVHSFTEDRVYTSPSNWIKLKRLTREKLVVETLVEGQPVVEGETLYHKSIAAQGEVVGWCNNTVMLDTGRGVAGFSTHVLTRTDPTILFYVEGKPVRKGDKLYSTVCHSYGDLREITGVHESRVYSTPDCSHKGRIEELTWCAPEIELPTGEVVYPGTRVWQKQTGEGWEVVSYNKLYGTLFVRNDGRAHMSLEPSSVKLSAPLFKLEGKPVFEGDKVWTLGGDKVVVKRLERGKVITSPSDWSCCTVFTQDWLSLTPIPRIIVDCEAVEHEKVLYFLDSGKEFKVFRQVRDRLEDYCGRSVDPSQLTRNDPTLVEVPIWVNFNDDGTSAVMFNSPGVTRCVNYQAKGTLQVPKHIADKLKR